MRRVWGRGFAATIAVGAAGVLAACGGGNGGEDGQETEEFVAGVEALCVEQAEELESAVFSEGLPRGPEEARAQLEEQIAIEDEYLTQLQERDPTDEVADGYAEFIANREEANAKLDEALDLVEDPEAANEVYVERDEILDEGEATGTEIGLEACVGVLPEDAEEAVIAATEEIITSTDQKLLCSELFTENYVEFAFGGPEGCVNDPSAGEAGTLLEVVDVDGIEGVGASAEVVTVGSGAGPKPDLVRFDFVEEPGGVYELDSVFPVEIDVDPADYQGDPAAGETSEAGSEVDGQLLDAAAPVRKAIDRFNSAEVQSELSSLQAAARDLRDAYFEFDATVRELEVAPDAQDELNALLEAIGDVIVDLDAIGELSDQRDASEAIDAVVESSTAVDEASAELRDALAEAS